MTAKERIIEQYRVFTPEEIAENIGVSVYYVNRVIKAHTANLRLPLTLKKNDLAVYFGVSRWTINRFESKPEIKEYFERYMRFREDGMYLKNLSQELCGILEMLELFEPKSRTAKAVKAILDQIRQYDKKDN